MKTIIGKRSHKAGLPPGSLVPVGPARDAKINLTVIDYDAGGFNQMEVERVEDCLPYRDTATVTWVNVDGVHDPELIRVLGEGFGLHPLTLEDIFNVDHRPKMEDFGDYLFVTLKMLYPGADGEEIVSEQISLAAGRNFVISFQEAPGDVFQPVRERLKKASGRIRSRGPDYLAYALIDAVVDQYFLILENLGETIESTEDDLIKGTEEGVLDSIYLLRREMVLLRRAIWPLREVIGGLEKSESELIDHSTRVYLRDLFDHYLTIIDAVEIFREMLSAMLDSYRSIISEKMNSVMKVLTIIATIFIPLTFIAGVYGMNFEHMPELKQPWGYPLVWLVMLALAGVMAVYFKRKKWM